MLVIQSIYFQALVAELRTIWGKVSDFEIGKVQELIIPSYSVQVFH